MTLYKKWLEAMALDDNAESRRLWNRLVKANEKYLAGRDEAGKRRSRGLRNRRAKGNHAQ